MKRIASIVVMAVAMALAGNASANHGPFEFKPFTRALKPFRALFAQAGAPAQVQCTVTEIYGSNEGKGMDPKISALLQNKLKAYKYDTFKQLGEHSVTAPHKKKATVTLTTGGKATLVYKDAVTSGKNPRLRLSLDLEDKNGNEILDTTFQVDSGDAWLASGKPDDKGGVYILGVGCK